jgi:hypothetical protein
MSQTVVRTSAVGSIPILQRYSQQHEEWKGFVCAKLTTPIERVLRYLHGAARLASKQKGMKDIEPMFRAIVSHVSKWTDEECAKEFSDSPKEIDACIRMAVRAHAIVMALTISRQCKEIIKVPNSQTFFRHVLADTASEHNVEVFGSQDFAVRKHLRVWITENIAKHLLALVPVSLFTEEDEPEPEEPKPKAAETCTVEPPPSKEAIREVSQAPIELTCDDSGCSVTDKQPLEGSIAPPSSPQTATPEPEPEKKEAEKAHEPVQSPQQGATQLHEDLTCPVSRESQDDIV